MRPPIENEAEQRHYDRALISRQYSYDLTQKLTFFIIGVELIFCGYILLNAEKLGAINYASELFLVAGLAAFFGVLWRFCYNQNHYDATHEKQSKLNLKIKKVETVSYNLYVLLTVGFFVSLLATGYFHLLHIQNSTKNKIIQTNVVVAPLKEAAISQNCTLSRR